MGQEFPQKLFDPDASQPPPLLCSPIQSSPINNTGTVKAYDFENT